MNLIKMEGGKSSIDAVITWVNGNDPGHRKKRAKALGSNGEEYSTSLLTGSDETRFIENGELQYCLASIREFMPWIRKIFIITDNQSPDFLTPKLYKRYNIEIVDHSTLFDSYEWALPTFNSRSIETMMWRIPGLASKFIYFNDDFIVTKTSTPEDFFTGSKVVLRGKWKKIKHYGSVRLSLNKIISYIAKNAIGITRSLHLLQQIRSAQAAGFEKKYYKIPHIPHPIYTETLKNFFSNNLELLKNNIQYPFRDTNQFSAVFLAHHIEIKKDNATLRSAKEYKMLNGEIDIDYIASKKIKRIREDSVQFFCLQAFEKFGDKIQKQLRHELTELLNHHELLENPVG